MSKKGESSAYYNPSTYRQYSHVITPFDGRKKFNMSDVPEHILADCVTRDLYNTNPKQKTIVFIDDEPKIKKKRMISLSRREYLANPEKARFIFDDEMLAVEIADLFSIAARNVQVLAKSHNIIGQSRSVKIQAQDRVRTEVRIVYKRNEILALAERLKGVYNILPRK